MDTPIEVTSWMLHIHEVVTRAEAEKQAEAMRG